MIFFVGYYGFQNAGEEAILAALLEQFRDRRVHLRLVVVSGRPECTAATHRVEAVACNDVAAVQRAVDDARLVMLSSSGLLHIEPALLARLYRKPVMLHGAGKAAVNVSSALRLLDAPQRIEALEREQSAMRGELARGAEYCRGLESSLQDYAGRLNATLNGVQQFDAVLRRQLTLWREQRAWQIMLLIRKAYTLFRRSKGAFLRWVLGLPLGRIGSLAE